VRATGAAVVTGQAQEAERLSRVPSRLPPDIADFTGRKQQVAQILDHLSGVAASGGAPPPS
jgi:hypothetical protein